MLSIVVIVITWQRAEVAHTPNEDMSIVPSTGPVISETQLPEFARIEVRDGVRVLVNDRDGYEITLEDNWRPEYYTNVVEIFVEDEYPSGELTASFVVSDNLSRDLSLEVWKERWFKFSEEDCPGCYEEEKKLNVNGLTIVKIYDNAGMGDRYNYIFIKDGVFFDVTAANISEKDVVDLAKTLKVI